MEDLNIIPIERESTRTYSKADFYTSSRSAKTPKFYLSSDFANELLVEKGDEILIGRVGTMLFIARNPSGSTIRGYPLLKTSASKSYHFANKLLFNKIEVGEYNADKKNPIMKSGILWYKLDKVSK